MKPIDYRIFLFALLAMSCNKPSKLQTNESHQLSKNDTYFHYSIWWAFVNKVFDADLSVAELKKNGDTGLGSFNMLNGEMVMVNGIAYQITEDGKVSEDADADKIVYANAAFFETEISSTISGAGMGLDSLKSRVAKRVQSPNFFFVVLVRGKFDKIKLGGLAKQERPFKDGLDVLIPARPVFEAANISGTMVGFYCPEFIGNMAVKGFHFHFISDDKRYGGHVMELASSGELNVEIDRKTDIHFYLPDNDDFAAVGFDKQFQYKKD
ncbi:MAG TPA: acetolactate decarboxylase [Cyclobacteriaceae bacterium]|nr:acetolactate decarboxylase [Cyclobacteriaceae bacterium]